MKNKIAHIFETKIQKNIEFRQWQVKKDILISWLLLFFIAFFRPFWIEPEELIKILAGIMYWWENFSKN